MFVPGAGNTAAQNARAVQGCSAVIETRVATDEDFTALCEADGRAFGFTYTEERMADVRPIMELDRFRLACDGGQIVGVVGAFSLDVTLPGGATVPMGGVTWVSAAATHRRQGIVSRLMRETHEDIVRRGEPLANLTASESGIYERFGYGIANHIRAAQILKSRAQFADEFRSAPGSVRFMSADEAREVIPPLWERYRRTRAGEVSRSAAMHELIARTRGRPDDGESAALYLRHADGYASYRVAGRWQDGWPNDELRVSDLVALTPEAHAALWHTILGIDLVTVVKVYRLPEDDPLPYLLTGHRAVQTTALNDGLWVNVLDVERCFGSRRYQTEDRLVVEVHAPDGSTSRWAIEGGLDGAACTRVRSRPDLTMPWSSLGALLYGGIRPSMLAAGRRLTARDADVLRRADLFLTWPTAPYCQTPY